MRKVIFSLLIIFTISILPVYAIDTVKIASMTYSVQSTTTTVENTATPLPATALAGRESIAIINVNSVTKTVYIGGSDVTTTNGYPLTNTSPAISLDIDDSVVIYGIVTSGTADVRTLEAK